MTAPHRRGTLLPVAAIGIASAGLSAVVGHHSWAHVTGTSSSVGAGLSSTLSVATEAGRVPGATALSLVLLACWGVVLVTRGRVRVAVAWLGLLTALGAVAAVVLGFIGAADQVRETYAQFGLTDVVVTRSVWSYLAFPVVLLALGGAIAAVRLVRTWPEMGRRYDTPDGAGDETGQGAQVEVPVGDDQDDVRVWRELNEGRDPTV